jgi:hypothetical protein
VVAPRSERQRVERAVIEWRRTEAESSLLDPWAACRRVAKATLLPQRLRIVCPDDDQEVRGVAR